jgi:pyruvate/2-oxoglutarate dehydrogenase complex dihydrolipoamide acyltransferase (E2) component
VKHHPLLVPDLELEDDVPMRVSLWLARPGEQVKAQQSLVEIAAGPIVVDLPSPVDGILHERLVEEDHPVHVGQVLARIEVEEEVGGLGTGKHE